MNELEFLRSLTHVIVILKNPVCPTPSLTPHAPFLFLFETNVHESTQFTYLTNTLNDVIKPRLVFSTGLVSHKVGQPSP